MNANTTTNTEGSRFCPRHGVMHNRDAESCSRDCNQATSTTFAQHAPASIAVKITSTRPQYDGVGLIGALDEWVRWSA